ncbi:unnamed protein product [Medioppia subpectinata]|uniref:NR LBD domain-containing protein n=1 Tax=Medioppia subpectinata TaxID=1979941 RepID=A0A7R9KB58_9ACAR|nr:unnamed protein product [Medioppia subpectinata]CAG2100223.1 unnamed protein product [Medioppia subpectinata]
MHAEFIRNKSENQLRRQLITDNKVRRHAFNEYRISSTSNPSTDPTIDEFLMCEVLGNNYIDFDHDEFDKQITQLQNNVLAKSDSVIGHNDYKTHNISIIPIFKSLTDYNGLNELEMCRISELKAAFNVFDYPLPKCLVQITSLEELLRKSVNKNELFVKDVTRFLKRLHSYKSLCPEDQLALLKHGFNELTSDCDDMSAVVKVDIFMYDDQEFKDMVIKHVDKMMVNWEFDDPTIIYLLTAIMVFDPNRPELTHRVNIRLEQQLLAVILNSNIAPNTTALIFNTTDRL